MMEQNFRSMSRTSILKAHRKKLPQTMKGVPIKMQETHRILT